MNPTGIFLVFLFLALLIVLGVVLAGFGGTKLVQRVRGGATQAGVLSLTWQSLVTTLGLLFCAYGGFAIFRLVWGG